MKKKLAAGVLSVVLVVGGATVAFGATNPDKLSEIKALTQQMFGIQKQIVDKEVAAGLKTSEQADAMKKFIDKRQQSSDQALADGKVFGPGMRKGMDNKGTFKGKEFNNGQPMTADQIKTWTEKAQARLTAQVDAMKSNSKLTAEQIQTWSDAAKAQLKVQAEAMANGTFVPGDMGMGMRGGNRHDAFGEKIAPTKPATTPPVVTK
ncbi:MAG TPA: DUF2680 domain-containing protein [Alphaproteobacteria bacterium]|nr:DUF2680 domain-containing protein [Alphaproteobacteria bacterium]